MSISLFAAAILASAVQGTLSEDGKSWAAKEISSPCDIFCKSSFKISS